MSVPGGRAEHRTASTQKRALRAKAADFRALKRATRRMTSSPIENAAAPVDEVRFARHRGAGACAAHAP